MLRISSGSRRKEEFGFRADASPGFITLLTATYDLFAFRRERFARDLIGMVAFEFLVDVLDVGARGRSSVRVRNFMLVRWIVISVATGKLNLKVSEVH
jgi:hypothetical protein